MRRYGFHGLSYEHRRPPGAAVPHPGAGSRHRGAGASLCALLNGVSIATTTGFSALDRLAGDTLLFPASWRDPVSCCQGRSFADIEDMFWHAVWPRSACLASAAINCVLLPPATISAARDAIELFTYRIACEAARWQGRWRLDGLVFTAGIEHAQIRAAVCAHLTCLACA